MAFVEQQVSDLRELEPTTEVPKAFMNNDELRQEIETNWFEDYTPEDARDDALVLSTFDFLSPDLDLYSLYLDLLTEQVAGFYDSEEDEFFLIGDEENLEGFQRLTFAHEYVHALQDQHYDLESYDRDALADENPDAERALTALIEGDAELITEQYLVEHFSPDDMQVLFDQVDQFDSTVLDGSPEILQRDLTFPYAEGTAFVRALYAEGGWRLVDDAYTNPPASTEQILHPERYLKEEEPQPVTLEPTLDVLGAGWRLVDEGTLGEFYLLAYLEQQVDPTVAAEAADGWGGDRYAVFQHEDSGQLVMVLRMAWDAPGDAAEFAEAYRTYGAGRAGRDPTTAREDLTCWTAQDYLCMALNGSEAWVVLGPNRPTVRPVLAQYAISD